MIAGNTPLPPDARAALNAPRSPVPPAPSPAGPWLARATPPRLNLMGRPRRMAQLDAQTAPALWFTAQAGAGKTCLALEWRAHRMAQRTPPHAPPAATVWLRHDETDHDPVACLADLARAVQQAGAVPPAWQPPPLLAEHLPHLGARLRQWVRALVAALHGPTLLVLDDAHTCQHAPWYGGWLVALCEELGEHHRLLVLSRQGPPAALARLQVQGQLASLQATDWRFDDDEAERLFEALGCPQVRQRRPALFEAAHGWPAGVALLAQWARHRPAEEVGANPRAACAARPTPLDDYFSAEVFDVLPRDARQTLMAAALPPYVHPSWLATLCLDPEAPARFLDLARQGLLLYGYEDGSWTVHPLFRRFLLERAQIEVEAAEATRRLAVAAQALLDDGRPELAVELCLEQGDPTRAAATMLPLLPPLVAQARHDTVLRWVDALPTTLRHPTHGFWLAAARFLSEPRAARESLVAGFAELPGGGPLALRQRALGLIASSFYFDAESPTPPGDTLAALVDVEAEWARCADEPVAQAHVVHAAWTTCVMVQPPQTQAEPWLQRARALMQQTSDATLRARLAVMTGLHLYDAGRHQELLQLDALAQEAARQGPPAPYADYLLHLLRLQTLAAQGDWPALQQSTETMLTEGERAGLHNMDAHFRLYLAMAHGMQGRPDDAAEAIARVVPELQPGRVHLRCHHHGLRAWLALREGQTLLARQHLDAMAQAATRHGNALFALQHAQLDLQARTLEALAGPAGSTRPAVWTAACDRLRTLAQGRGHPLARLHELLCEARLALHEGDDAVVGARLGEALDLMRPHSLGWVALALDEVLAPLCDRGLRAGLPSAPLRDLIQAHRLRPPDGAPPSWPRGLMLWLRGQPRVELQGEALALRGQARRKQVELLCFLATHPPAQGCALDDVADALWPEADGDAARHALETTLSRLRGWIGRGRVWHRDGRLGLNPDDLWCDLWHDAEADPDAALLEGWDQPWVAARCRAWRPAPAI